MNKTQKNFAPIVVKVDGRLKVASDEQESNDASPMVVSAAGRVTLNNELGPLNEPASIVVKNSGRCDFGQFGVVVKRTVFGGCR